MLELASAPWAAVVHAGLCSTSCMQLLLLAGSPLQFKLLLCSSHSHWRSRDSRHPSMALHLMHHTCQMVCCCQHPVGSISIMAYAGRRADRMAMVQPSSWYHCGEAQWPRPMATPDCAASRATKLCFYNPNWCWHQLAHNRIPFSHLVPMHSGRANICVVCSGSRDVRSRLRCTRPAEFTSNLFRLFALRRS